MAVSQDAIDILCEVFPDKISCVLDTPDCISYVYYDAEGYPAGTAMYGTYIDTDGTPYVFIYWLGVRYRGCGIGTKILTRLHQQYPMHYFCLGVRRNNDYAIKFYHKLGYHCSGKYLDDTEFWHFQREPTTGA